MWPEACLRRALLTAWVLRRHDPVLSLGLMAGGVTAHAWLEADGRTYGAADVRSYFVQHPRSPLTRQPAHRVGTPATRHLLDC